MGLISKIKHAVEHVIDDVKDLGKGIKEVAQGAGKMLGSLARLDFKGVAAGANEMVEGATRVAIDAIKLSPEGMAAHMLLGDKLDKTLDKVEKLTDKVLEAGIDSVINTVGGLKDGLKEVAQGIRTGNWKEVAEGAMGIASSAMALTPEGMVLTAASSMAQTGVTSVIGGKAGRILGDVAGSVVGIRNPTELVATAAGTALGSSGVLNKVPGMQQVGEVTTALGVGADMYGAYKGHHGGPTEGPHSQHESQSPHGKTEGNDSSGSTHETGGHADASPDGQRPVNLSGASRQETAQSLRENLSPSELKELQQDLGAYFKNGNDEGRQKLKEKWGDRIDVDYHDTGSLKTLLFGAKDARTKDAGPSGKPHSTDDNQAANDSQRPTNTHGDVKSETHEPGESPNSDRPETARAFVENLSAAQQTQLQQDISNGGDPTSLAQKWGGLVPGNYNSPDFLAQLLRLLSESDGSNNNNGE